MKKRFLMVAVATMTCTTIAGCNNSGSRVVELAPGVTVEVNGNQGSFTLGSDEFDPYGTADASDSIGTVTTDASEEEYVPVVESVADSFGVKLEDNQYIITANDKKEEAIVLNALEGYKFENRHSFNDAYLVNADHSDSYLIYDCSGTLTKDSLADMKDVEDKGDECYIQNKETIKAFCFKDDVSISVVYNNTKDNTDVDKVVANIKSIVKNMTICK